jgi:hypothetical protein
MRKKRIACVYGEDGLDPDVLLNQIDFLKKYGFRVVFATKLIKCDVLIVTRVIENGFVERINTLLVSQIKMILFLDYSGQNCHRAFKEIVHRNKYLITSRGDCRGEDIYFGHPYVSIDRWRMTPQSCKSRIYDCVHIGNYKSFSKDDKDIMSFNEIISKNFVHVFGDFWPGIGANPFFHGKLKLRMVSKIYRESNFAIGIKYPFQRGQAISGRYWHATLNGCALLVEDDYLINEIPGLYYYKCDSNLNLKNIMNQIVHSPLELEKSANIYWSASNKLQCSLLDFVDETAVKYGFIERVHLWRCIFLNFFELRMNWIFRVSKRVKKVFRVKI